MKVTVFHPPQGHRTMEIAHLGLPRSSQWAIDQILARGGRILNGPHFERISHLYVYQDTPELIWVRSSGCSMNLLTLSAGEYAKTRTDLRILVGATRPGESALDCAIYHNSVAPRSHWLKLMVHVAG